MSLSVQNLLLQESLDGAVWLMLAAVGIVPRGGGTGRCLNGVFGLQTSLGTFIRALTEGSLVVCGVQPQPINVPLVRAPKSAILPESGLSPCGLWCVECVYLTRSS